MSLIIALLLLSVLMNAVSQLSLKRGIMALRGINLQTVMHLDSLIRVAKNTYIIIWIALLVPSMLLWLKVLSLTDLSFAYPFQSLNVVFVALGSTLFLKERVTGIQWSGIVLILFGIILISHS